MAQLENRGEISPRELRRGGTRDPIRVDISATHHLGHGGCGCGGGEYALGKKIVSSFVQKYKNTLTHCRIFKYYSGQEIRTGAPESSDSSKGKMPQFSDGKCRTNSGREGG